jgi:hypothetical protein
VGDRYDNSAIGRAVSDACPTTKVGFAIAVNKLVSIHPLSRPATRGPTKAQYGADSKGVDNSGMNWPTGIEKRRLLGL